MAEPVARQLGGRYEVRSLIGRGGMAEVHLGFDKRLSRIVAVKMLREELARDSIFQARFRREAQSAASLNHPNIVAVYDTGEETIVGADGRSLAVPYIVMEYVEGHTVKDLLSDGTPVPIDEAIEITSGVLSALEYSHSKGLVHRDIKPGNIMLTTQGKVKVMDFGIARALSDSQSTMTQTNAVVGTAQYLSPEQARGEQVDTRSDLYSTGVVLFELLTGQPPFKGDSAVSVAYQHVQQLPPRPSSIAADVPEPLDRIVLKALAKNPEDRYATASAMKVDLIRLASGAPVNAPDVSVWTAGATQVTQALPASAAVTATAVAPAVEGTQTLPSIPEDPETPETSKRKPIVWILGLLILALALIGGIIYAMTGEDTPQSVTVTVPDVTGKTQEEAKTTVEALGLKWALGAPEAHDTIPEGSVIRTDPVGNTQIAEGGTVTAILSTGPASTSVPDGLVGMTPDEAKAAVEAAGLVWKVDPTQEPSEDVESGKITRTNPSSGQRVKKGTEVTGWVSSGSSKVDIPDLSGHTQAEAREALNALGLSVGNVEVTNHPSVPADRVISTNPAAGAEAKKGDSVLLILSNGKVTIPSGLIGSSKDAVVSTLNGQLGLEITITEQYDRNAAAGLVTQMSVTEGAEVAQGSKVAIVVSKGPDPNATQTNTGSRS